MPTFSITYPTDEAKKQAYDFFKNMRDEKGLANADIMNLLMKVYIMGIDSISTIETNVPVQRILDEVNCYYLRFEDLDFKCFEKFKKKKKPDLLGRDTPKVLLRCETCRQGEADEIRKQYQKKLRGQNIKGILQMIKLFQDFAKEGVPATIYFCNRIPGRQVMTGKRSMTCTKHEARVPIETTCKDPRCQYFEEYTIKVESQFPQEALHLIQGIAEEYELLQDLRAKKTVESEPVEQDG